MSLKANELRLGLYVNTPRSDQNPFRIDAFEYLHNGDAKVAMNIKEGAHPLTWYLKDLSGIPITNDDLVKCGLNKRFFKAYEIKPLDGHKGKFGLFIQRKWQATKIQYLHQLQNLYFALTGTELILTEK